LGREKERRNYIPSGGKKRKRGREGMTIARWAEISGRRKRGFGILILFLLGAHTCTQLSFLPL